MRYRLIVEYDGTLFCGWQRQEGVDSIQARLEEAIRPIAKIFVIMKGAGRTDAGVHACAQVAHFDLDQDLDCFRIQECMNFYLKDVPISVLKIEKVEDTFDARLSALSRTYLYKILNRRAKPAVDLNRVWWVKQSLDVEKMREASLCLLGKHDFSAFRAVGCQAHSPIKTMNVVEIWQEAEIIFFKFEAKSFLYHQIRNIMGSLFFVGTGKWSPDDFKEIFLKKDRTLAGPTAPPGGLYFLKVTY